MSDQVQMEYYQTLRKEGVLTCSGCKTSFHAPDLFIWPASASEYGFWGVQYTAQYCPFCGKETEENEDE